MSRGDWISFAELCRRCPEKSARTLRRMVAGRQLSSRQRCARGKLEFNWHTVQGELAALENPGRLTPKPVADHAEQMREFAHLVARELADEIVSGVVKHVTSEVAKHLQKEAAA
jgi:hypothetical protein